VVIIEGNRRTELYQQPLDDETFKDWLI